MHTKLTSRPIDTAMAAIQALDLEPIRLRVMDAELGEGWTREYAESVEGAYRNYLTMLVKHPEDVEGIVVSKDVDEFWHAHILHTMKYTEDCEKVFGKYLHHNPHVGERTRADIEKKATQTDVTRRLYLEEFGSDAAWFVKPRWPENSAMCAASVGAKGAAMCAAAVQAEKGAMCAAAIRAENAAMCAASVGAEDAAMCAAAIRPENATMCAAAIRVENVAMCAAIKAEDAAMCAASIPAGFNLKSQARALSAGS